MKPKTARSIKSSAKRIYNSRHNCAVTCTNARQKMMAGLLRAVRTTVWHSIA